MTGIEGDVERGVNQGQALAQHLAPSGIPSAMAGPASGPIMVGVRAVCRPLPFAVGPDLLVRIAVSVGPLLSRIATERTWVTASASALTLDPVMGAVIGHVVALESGVGMVGPVCAIDGQT